MQKQLLISTLLVGTALGKAPTITMVVDVPTQVDLARLREIYDIKRDNKDDKFNKNCTDWPVFQAVFHAVREEPCSLLFNRTTFHLDDPQVLADVCSQVPPAIMGLILDTVEPDIDEKVAAQVRTLVETRNEWGSDCQSCQALRAKLLKLLVRRNIVGPQSNDICEDTIRAFLESGV